MSIAQLVRELADRGVNLFLKEGELYFDAPRHAVNDELLLRIQENKHELKRHVTKIVGRNGDGRSRRIARDEARVTFPLSYSQNHIWLLSLVSGGKSRYNLTSSLTVHGALDVDCLRRAFATIVGRHESLRIAIREESAEYVQTINDDYEFDIDVHDFRRSSAEEQRQKVDAFVRAEADHAFDLGGEVLLRVAVLRLADDVHVIVLNQHQIATDGWSTRILVQELDTLYRAYRRGAEPDLPDLPIRYADYAVWQRESLSDPAGDPHLRYWRERLAGLPRVHSLPLDHTRPATRSYAGAHLNVTLDPTLRARLEELCKRTGTAKFSLIQAALSILIARYSGEKDVVIGTSVANRTREEVEPLIGCFVNNLVLRSDLSANEPFEQYLRRVARETREALSHQATPFELLVEELNPERSLSHSPLFQIMLVFQSANEEVKLGDLRVQMDGRQFDVSKVDLTLGVFEKGDETILDWEYATDLFTPETIARMARNFVTLLESICADSSTNVFELPMLSDEERRLVVETWNETAVDYAGDECLHELFARQALRTPHAKAVVSARGDLTYVELLHRSLHVARILREQNVVPNELVAVLAPKGWEQIVGVFGVLFAGAAYLPIEAAWPQQRRADVIRAGNARVLLATSDLQTDGLGGDAGLQVVRLDSLQYATPLAAEDYLIPQTDVTPADLAYVIFTSGSTGVPKGVMIEHAAVINTLVDLNRRFGVTERDSVLGIASLAFDMSVYDVFGPLIAGACLVLPGQDDKLNPAEWLRLIETHGITLWNSVPAVLQLTVELMESVGFDRHLPLRVGLLSGDWIPVSLPDRTRRFIDGMELVSLGGATEASIWSILYRIGEVDPAWSSIPYGRPMENQAFYVLDENLLPCPIGVEGDLYIGGIGLARGYWNDEEKTNRSFIRHEGLGRRIYRTGDRGRYFDDGNIEFLGRRDDQIKIRGFRIELGDIEAHLTAIDGVKDGVVLASGETADDKRLVAYVVPASPLTDDDRSVFVGKVRQALKAALPDYMVPQSYVVLAELPLSPNGKVDRKRLRDEAGAVVTVDHAIDEPRTETEKALSNVWARLLRTSRIGVNEDFFALGGHSLLAAKMVNEIRAAFGVELPIRAVFECPTIAELASRLDTVTPGTGGSEMPALTKADCGGRPPASFAQKRLWFIAKLSNANASYNIPAAVTVRGRLDVQRIERTFSALVRRHAPLRTNFAEENGRLVQVVRGDFEFEVGTVDLTSLERSRQDEAIRASIRAECMRPFDLENDLMIRVTLYRRSDDEHVMLVVQHHIASDGWSIGIMMRELRALYAADTGAPVSLPPFEFDYGDYAAWQQQWLEDEVLERELDYWRERLRDLPLLHRLPTDFERPEEGDFRGDHLEVELAGEALDQLRALARRQGVTLFTLLRTALAVLIARYADDDDIVLGSPVANRAHKEIEPLIGFFVNTVVLRTRIDGNPSFTELLQQTHREGLDDFAHQHVPFEAIVDALNPQRSIAFNPLFQITFSLQQSELLGGEQVDLAMERYDLDFQVARFDLSVNVIERERGLSIGWEFATSLFRRETVAEMCRRYLHLLDRIVKAPERGVRDLPIVTEDEAWELVLRRNRTATAYPSEKCIHEIFEERAAACPDAVALRCDGSTMTYRELDRQSNRLASYLLSRGIAREARIGLLMERSPELIVAILATLKAGGAYVPIDPDFPVERVTHLLENAGVELVLSTSGHRTRLQALPVRCVWLDLDEDDAGNAGFIASATNTAPRNPMAKSSDLAYLMYTSGSTGEPKGVMVEHRGVVRLACGTDYVPLNASTTTLLHSPIAFDATTFEIWAALLNGGEVVIFRPNTTELDALVDVMSETRVNTIFLTSAILPLWVNAAEGRELALEYLLVGGDVVPTRAVGKVHRLFPNVRVINVYGPTENTTFSTSYTIPVGFDPDAPLPIGAPIAQSTAFVLDARMRPVPPGCIGELYVGGDGVARGYLGKPELTAERFITLELQNGDTRRLYKTGDRARWRHDGLLVFLGRVDNQVKVNGYRVELEEIETALNQHDAVEIAAVLAVGDTESGKRLEAFVKLDEATPLDGRPDAPMLQAFLDARLPAYMVPSLFRVTDIMPLTHNGKVDRRALSRMRNELPQLAAGEYQPPTTETERQLVEIWVRLLELDRVGVTENFFALGGNSLRCVAVAAEVKEKLGVELELKTLFLCPTIRELARRVDELPRSLSAESGSIVPTRHDGTAPLTPGQTRIYFISRLEEGLAAYNIPTAMHLEGPLDERLIENVIARLIDRHAALRTVYREDDGVPFQVVRNDYAFSVRRDDLRNVEGDKQAALQRLVDEEALTPFDLENDLMIRVRLVKLAEEHHVLLLTQHHIASDGWSSAVLLDEFVRLYEARACGREAALEPLTVDYLDYVHCQAEWLRSDVHADMLDFWLERLHGIPQVHSLPLDKERPAKQSFQGALHHVRLSRERYEALKNLCAETGVTLFTAMHALFSVLLGRYSNETDIVVGTSVANRRQKEVFDLVGLFLNCVVLRADMSANPTFRQLLKTLHERNAEAFANQHVPFETLVERINPERAPAYTPLFQIMLVLIKHERNGLDLPGLEVSLAEQDYPISKFDLTLMVNEMPDSVLLTWEYATSLFEHRTIAAMAESFERLLDVILEDPDAGVMQVDLLTPEHCRIVEHVNDNPSPYERELLVHELVERQAAKTPEATAVIFRDAEVSYETLNRRANQIAHYLMSRGVGPGDIVALSQPRSVDMLVSLLAVLKANAAYVPLDPGYPDRRVRYVIENCGARRVLTTSSLRSRFEHCEAELICVDDPDFKRHVNEHLAVDPPVGRADAERRLAYVLYTSGSEGNPKGVMISHRNLASYLHQARRYFIEHDCAGAVVSTPLVFDATVTSLLTPLTLGKHVELLEEGDALLDVLADYLFDDEERLLFKITPAHLNALASNESARGNERARHVLIIGGEQLTGEALFPWLERLLPSSVFINEYGPTETTVGCCIYTARKGYCDGRAAGLPVPIGRPTFNTRLHVLNEHRAPQPLGGVGELYIESEGTARGYINDPDRTSTKFVPLPGGGANAPTVYRTGDIVRRMVDGSLLYIGRKDAQVKLRGYRIELGEIERVAEKHALVAKAVATVSGDRLLCYLVPTSGVRAEPRPGQAKGSAVHVLDDHAELADDVRALLSSWLPAYMVPSGFCVISRIPMTVNGKVDYRSLPDSRTPAAKRAARTAPANELEEQLCAIWREVLGTDDIGTNDNFFELGGHSLLVMRLVSRIRKNLRVELPISAIFEAPTVAALAARLASYRSNLLVPEIGVRPAGAAPVLSHSQQRMWFIDQLTEGSAQYNIPAAFSIRGAFDMDAFERAIHAIVERHAVLRTRFTVADGKPRQVIESEFAVPLRIVDLSEAVDADEQLEGLLKEDSLAPFDLREGLPVRILVAKISDAHHVVQCNVHHIAFDGWSVGILLRELKFFYDAFSEGRGASLPPLKIQYADYAHWQREWLSDEVLADEIRYWKGKLNGAPHIHDLPLDRVRPTRQSFAGRTLRYAIRPEIYARLVDYCRHHDITLFMYLETVFALLLYRYSNEKDVLVGTAVSGRFHKDLEPLIGFFVNTLVIRTQLEPDWSFSRLLDVNRKTILEAHAHQFVPFDFLVENLNTQRNLSHSAIFQVMFLFQQLEERTMPLAGGTLEQFDQEYFISKFDLTVTANQLTDGLLMNWEFATDLFDQSTIERMAANFETLLESCLATPETSIGRLDVLSPRERRLVVHDWNATERPYPSEKRLHELFIEQARRTPSAKAVTCYRHSLTYDELLSRAREVARTLGRLGVERNELVGVVCEKSCEQVIAVLGVLFSGGAYLPVDRTWPLQRQQEILRAGKVRTVLTTDARSLGTDVSERCNVVTLDLNDWTFEALPQRDGYAEAADTVQDPEDIAYVIFTSGSTGKPKGVVIQHRAVINTIVDINRRFDVKPTDKLLGFSSLAFDLSVYDIFGGLAAGAHLIMPHDADIGDPARWVELVEKHGITVWQTVPSVFQMLVSQLEIERDRRVPLRLAMLSGDWIPVTLPDRGRARIPGIEIVSLGGATEGSIWSICYPIGEVDPSWPSIPYGKPLENQKFYILNESLQHTPTGVRGDLYIAGVGLAAGYWEDEEKTRASFIHHPELGETIYRTGDTARYLEDGNIEFLGRVDTQVKIRGFRIELGEIEARLRACEGITDCVVLVRRDEGREARLVAYLVPAAETVSRGDFVDAVNATLRQELPAYMVPSSYVLLDKLPLTANGKVDRKSLPAPDSDGEARDEYFPPETEIEKTFCAIWEQVLGIERCGIADNFFRIGGDSLAAVRVVHAAASHGLTITTRDVFEHQTVRDLAAAARLGTERDRSILPQPIQRWLHGRGVGQDRLVPLAALELRRRISADLLRRLRRELVSRHPNLAKVIRSSGGEWSLTPPADDAAGPDAAVVFADVELEGGAGDAERIDRVLAAHDEIDLARGPLFRLVHFERAGGGAVLCLLAHPSVAGFAVGRSLAVAVAAELGSTESDDGLQSLRSGSGDASVCPLLDRGGPSRVVVRSRAGDPRLHAVSANARTRFIDERSAELLLGDANRAFYTRREENFVTAALMSLGRQAGCAPHGSVRLVEIAERSASPGTPTAERSDGLQGGVARYDLKPASELAEIIDVVKETTRAALASSSQPDGRVAHELPDRERESESPGVVLRFASDPATRADGEGSIDIEHLLGEDDAYLHDARHALRVDVVTGAYGVNLVFSAGPAGAGLDLDAFADDFVDALDAIREHCAARLENPEPNRFGMEDLPAEIAVHGLHGRDGFESGFEALVRGNPQGSKPVIYAIPPGFGGAESYYALVEALSKDQPVALCENIEMATKQLWALPGVVEYYYNLIVADHRHGPVYLLGASRGAHIAHAVAAKLVESGREVGYVFLLDPVGYRSSDGLLARIAADERVALLDRDVKKLLDNFLHTEAYLHRLAATPYEGKGTIFQVTRNDETPHERTRLLAELVNDYCTLYEDTAPDGEVTNGLGNVFPACRSVRLQGVHSEILDEKNRAAICNEIDRVMARAAGA